MAGGHHDDPQTMQLRQTQQQTQQETLQAEPAAQEILDAVHRQRQQLANIHQSSFYVQPQVTDTAAIQRTKYMEDARLGSVRAAVERLMPHAYGVVDHIRSRPLSRERATVLHHSRGTQLLAGDNAHVLEFDIAGSGFRQFRSDFMGIKGKSSLKEYMKVHLTGAARVFSWLPFVVNAQLRRAKQTARQQLAQLEQGTLRWDALTPDEKHNVRVLAHWNDRIGKSRSVTINEKQQRHKHIREVKRGNKTRITIAGPLRMGGMRNAGSYSIENIRQYMLAIGQEYLTGIFSTWASGAPPHDVWLRIRGHSRGAVASIEGAMMIKKWILDNFPHYANHVHFDVTQFDPVPGTGSYQEHAVADIHRTDTQQDQNKMAPLGANAETTVVYSMFSDHTFFFTPQQVMNTKRIILMPSAHSVGLGDQDTAASRHANAAHQPRHTYSDETGDAMFGRTANAHRAAYTDAKTGDAYRNGSFNELPEGVYVVDETNTLVHLQDYAQWVTIQHDVLDGKWTQGDRSRALNAVIRNWFAAHEPRHLS